MKLTVSGASYTQPLTLKLDPRVKTSALALAQINTLTRELYSSAVNANDAAGKARALCAMLDAFAGLGIAEFKAQIDSVAGAAGVGARGGRGGFPGAPAGGGGRGGAGGAPAEGTARNPAAAWSADGTTPGARSAARMTSA